MVQRLQPQSSRELPISSSRWAARLPTLRRLRLPRRTLAERGLGGGEACDGNAERGARDVIERNLVAERDGGGVAAVLAADPDLELCLRLPTALDADPHQFAHALAVDGDERIARENPARHVGAEKARGVVAADAEDGLGQVVGAEGKEFRGLGISEAARPK